MYGIIQEFRMWNVSKNAANISLFNSGVYTNDYVHYWPMNETFENGTTIKDYGGIGYDGILIDTASPPFIDYLDPGYVQTFKVTMILSILANVSIHEIFLTFFFRSCSSTNVTGNNVLSNPCAAEGSTDWNISPTLCGGEPESEAWYNLPGLILPNRFDTCPGYWLGSFCAETRDKEIDLVSAGT